MSHASPSSLVLPLIGPRQVPYDRRDPLLPVRVNTEGSSMASSMRPLVKCKSKDRVGDFVEFVPTLAEEVRLRQVS